MAVDNNVAASIGSILFRTWSDYYLVYGAYGWKYLKYANTCIVKYTNVVIIFTCNEANFFLKNESWPPFLIFLILLSRLQINANVTDMKTRAMATRKVIKMINDFKLSSSWSASAKKNKRFIFSIKFNISIIYCAIFSKSEPSASEYKYYYYYCCWSRSPWMFCSLT